jgi:CHAT domain-containing protein/tetratricopeptide (TPR) repeat protein
MSEQPQGGEKTISCYADSRWLALAGGMLPSGETAPMLEHANTCASCAAKLAESIRVLHGQATQDEDAMLGQLNSATQQWQCEMGARLAHRSAPSRAPRWLALAAALVIGVGGAIAWLWLRTTQPPFSELAQAYSERRTLELRFPGAAHAAMSRENRGPNQRMNWPSLLEAEARIARRGDSRDQAWLLARARAEVLRRHYREAIATSQTGLEASPDSDDLLSVLAMSLFESGEDGNAADYGKAAELYSRILQNHPMDVVARFNRAIVYEKLQMFREATSDWEEFLRTESQGGWADEARHHLADDRAKLSRFNQPPLSVEPGDIAVLTQLRDAYLASSLDSRSISALSDSFATRYGDWWLRDLISHRDRPGFRDALRALDQAATTNQRGDSVHAAEQGRLAAISFDRQKNPAGEARARFEVIYALRRSSNAVACLEEGRPLAKKLGSLHYYWLHAQALLELASCSVMRSDFTAADSFARAALSEDELRGFASQRMRSLGIRAEGLRAMGHWQEAWQLDVEGLRGCWNGSYPPARAYQFYEDMGYVAESNRDYHLAAALSWEAIAQIQTAGNHSVEAMVHDELGRRSLLAGNARDAEAAFSRGEQIFGQLPQDAMTAFYRATSEIGIARAEAQLGKTREALIRLEPISAGLVGFTNQVVAGRYYRALAEVQQAAENLKAETEAWRSLAEIAEVGLASISSPMDRLQLTEELRDAYRGLIRCALASDQPEKALTAWLSYRSADFGERRLHTVVPEFAQRLKHSTRVVYAEMSDGVAAWSYDDRGVVFHFLRVRPEVLSSLARRFVSDCSDPVSRPEEIREIGRKIFDTLVSPLIGGWDPQRILVLDVDGPAAQIPFEALPLPQGGTLGDLFTLELGPAIDEHRREDSASLDSAVLVAVGAPRITGMDADLFPPLPDSGSEAASVAAMFPLHTLFTENEATPSAVKQALSQATIFHFAGHAMNSPGQTGLILAAEKGAPAAAPGFLSARDLTLATLAHCRIAILSACSTAGMKSQGLAEPDSLPRALLTAGVHQIVASRWPVDSRATHDLMLLFYSELRRGQPTAAALKAANARLRASPNTSHPYYWAAFAVISDS